MFGLDPVTIEIVKKLTEVAGKIGSIVLSRRRDSMSKDKEEFYNRVKKYHERISDMLRRKKGSPKRLASDIAKDKLFTFLAHSDNSEFIVKALLYIEELPVSVGTCISK